MHVNTNTPTHAHWRTHTHTQQHQLAQPTWGTAPGTHLQKWNISDQLAGVSECEHSLAQRKHYQPKIYSTTLVLFPPHYTHPHFCSLAELTRWRHCTADKTAGISCLMIKSFKNIQNNHNCPRQNHVSSDGLVVWGRNFLRGYSTRFRRAC